MIVVPCGTERGWPSNDGCRTQSRCERTSKDSTTSPVFWLHTPPLTMLHRPRIMEPQSGMTSHRKRPFLTVFGRVPWHDVGCHTHDWLRSSLDDGTFSNSAASHHRTSAVVYKGWCGGVCKRPPCLLSSHGKEPRSCNNHVATKGRWDCCMEITSTETCGVSCVMNTGVKQSGGQVDLGTTTMQPCLCGAGRGMSLHL